MRLNCEECCCCHSIIEVTFIDSGCVRSFETSSSISFSFGANGKFNEVFSCNQPALVKRVYIAVIVEVSSVTRCCCCIRFVCCCCCAHQIGLPSPILPILGNQIDVIRTLHPSTQTIRMTLKIMNFLLRAYCVAHTTTHMDRRLKALRRWK